MTTPVGMMDEAYFVGRREILEWINSTLLLDLQKIEETASGCVALQLMDVCFPGQVSVQKLNWSARNDYEFIQNYKLLQTAFDKFHVDKYIPVDKIIRGKYQDNLEFMQWFKRFVETQGPSENYDPVLARSKGRGAPGALSCSNSSSRGSNKRDQPVLRKSSKTSSSALSSRTHTRNGSTQQTTNDASTAEIARLKDELEESNGKIDSLQNMMNLLERERDFYFEKLRDIEVIAQNMDNTNDDILYTSFDMN